MLLGRRLERALADFGADESFEKAAAKTREHYGIEIGASRVMRVSLKHAGKLAQRQPQACTRLPAKGAGWIIAEADGSMVPVVDIAEGAQRDKRKRRVVRWQEARVVAAQKQGQASALYDATLGEVSEAGTRWSAIAGQCDWGMDTQIHVVGDGAPWIEQQARERFAGQGRYLLDLYHVCEYLAAVWPGQGEKLAALREALKENRHEKVLEQLRGRQESEETPEEQAPARRALRYLENRRGQLGYAEALAAELPVGSGLIESAHRHVVQARIKKAGAWWKPENAQAMLQLRVTRANNLWNSYWLNN